MPDADKPDASAQPRLTPRAQADAQARRDRQAAALRENLRRRKQQSRDRAAEEAAPPAVEASRDD